jgi:hypothetical protein
MLSALDPLGLPVATDVVPGQRADDPRSIPAIPRVRAGLGRGGRLEGGAGPMGARETRALLHAGGADELCPGSEGQRPPAVLAPARAPVWTGPPAWTMLHRLPQEGPPERSAEGWARVALLTAEVAGTPASWRARRGLSRSGHLAHAGERGWRARLATAPAASAVRNERHRGRRRDPAPRVLRAAVDTILARSRVQGLRHLREKAPGWARPWRRAGRRATTVPVEGAVPVTGSRHEAAVAEAGRPRGWRGEVPPQPPDQRSRQEVGLASRREELVERARGRRQGRPLALTPLSLARDDQATGGIRLLASGVRGLPRLEFVMRRRLAPERTGLAGLSVGNPPRATARPTTERLLARVDGLTLTIIRAGRRRRDHLTPLARVPRRRLALLHCPGDLSLRRCPDSHKPPSK